MRGFFGRTLMGAIAVAFLLSPTLAVAEPLIPAKRLAISDNTDLPGGDISSIFDTTLEACERACLTNSKCEAFTFNTRNGSCFPKSKAGEAASFDGAVSGVVLKADAQVVARAAERRAELSFVQDWELASVLDQANQIGNFHNANGYSAEENLAAARDAEANGNLEWAFGYTGAAVSVSDAAADWAEYARLLLAASNANPNQQGNYRDRAYYASVNAYLRADHKA